VPTAYPTGWFVIAFSEEISAGDLRPLRYFGQDLVLFRGQQDGAAHVLDAHCPHLGAHLGIGGTVEGDAVRCPFHAWSFDGGGACVKIPYSEKIPRRAKLRSWPVRERNGMIFVWHATDGAAPSWEIPEMPEHGDPGWTGWDWSVLEIATKHREIVENVADKAHFPTVHGTHVEVFDNEFDGHLAIQRSKGVAYPRGGGTDRFELTATYHGPAWQLSEMRGVLESRMVNTHTPIDEDHLHLRFAVMLPKLGPQDRMAAISKAYIDNLRTGFHEDIAIWEHKRWREPPVLCRGDGPIGPLRRWYAQFYAP
jgi:3-ketosteroid 9alpha-monooxygenase subunit A